MIRYFGEREKIFMVHFRNIRGGYLNFEEVFPDEGDVDMYQCIKLYRRAGLSGDGPARPCAALGGGHVVGAPAAVLLPGLYAGADPGGDG